MAVCSASYLTKVYDHTYSKDQSFLRELMVSYLELFLDPITMDYYQGLFFMPDPEDTKNIKVPQLPKRHRIQRTCFVYITNFSPSVRIYSDTANDNFLYGQLLLKMPDFYKGNTGLSEYLYSDLKNKYKVVMRPYPTPNQIMKEVIYTGIHPTSKQAFYAVPVLTNTTGILIESS